MTVHFRPADSQTELDFLYRIQPGAPVGAAQCGWGAAANLLAHRPCDIVEFEQGGQSRAAYGKGLLKQLGQALSHEYGKGFEERNMRAFFQQFPNWNAARSELSWTHYRLLLRVDAPEARNWYMQEAAGQNWSTRRLDSCPTVSAALNARLHAKRPDWCRSAGREASKGPCSN